MTAASVHRPRDAEPPTIRAATAADVPAIARILVASWRATYAGIVPAAILERMDVDRNVARLRARIEASPEGASSSPITLVVEDGLGAVAGYALAGPCRDDDARELGEVEAIYLAPDARGRGLGRPLLEAAAAALRQAGFDTAVLWVLTANGPARRFYEAAGFRLDGAARTLDFDGTPIEEIRYRRSRSG